jgi:hypothetical protein
MATNAKKKEISNPSHKIQRRAKLDIDFIFKQEQELSDEKQGSRHYQYQSWVKSQQEESSEP